MTTRPAPHARMRVRMTRANALVGPATCADAPQSHTHFDPREVDR
jgi:hypothetical protein